MIVRIPISRLGCVFLRAEKTAYGWMAGAGFSRCNIVVGRCHVQINAGPISVTVGLPLEWPNFSTSVLGDADVARWAVGCFSIRLTSCDEPTP